MTPLYSKLEYDSAKSNTYLLCECERCKTPFKARKCTIKRSESGKFNYASFCSTKCSLNNFLSNQGKKPVPIKCTNCDKEFMRRENEKRKSGNNFCSRSCSATFHNKNKNFGNRRSKLEKIIEQELTIKYPNLEISYNSKEAIGSELDVYIPSLNLAFELNGIFHYQPIFGVNKLDQIQANDINKYQKCLEAKIDLCIIDTSSQSYVKLSTSKKFIDIIMNIIDERLLDINPIEIEQVTDNLGVPTFP